MNYWIFPGIPQEAREVTYWRAQGQSSKLLKNLAACVSDAFEVRVSEMISPTRLRTVSEARHCFFFLGYKYTELPMDELSRHLKRHRTSGIHSRDTAKDLLAVDKHFRKRFEEAEANLKTIINDTYTGYRSF